MPNMPPHSCNTPNCLTPAPFGQSYCANCQAKNAAKPTTRQRGSHSKLYDQGRWKNPISGTSALMRRRNPICQYIDDFGVQCTHISDLVHHLVDPRDNLELFHDWSNLVAICTEHHHGGQRGETIGFKYCHTVGMQNQIYEHGFLYPSWHEKFVAHTGSTALLGGVVSSAGLAAQLRALAEPI